MLARELETGTFRYAWTQGYGRERWTIAKLILLAVVIVAVTAAFSQLFTWFFAPFIGQEDLNVYTATVFATRPVVFAAWTLAAFALSAFFGMLFRRIIPAMAVTLGVYFGLALLTWTILRKHYRCPWCPAAPASKRPHHPARPVGAELVDDRPDRVDALHPGQPVLADAVRRGRLAARALGAPRRRHRLAGPPPRGVVSGRGKSAGVSR